MSTPAQVPSEPDITAQFEQAQGSEPDITAQFEPATSQKRPFTDSFGQLHTAAENKSDAELYQESRKRGWPAGTLDEQPPDAEESVHNFAEEHPALASEASVKLPTSTIYDISHPRRYDPFGTLKPSPTAQARMASGQPVAPPAGAPQLPFMETPEERIARGHSEGGSLDPFTRTVTPRTARAYEGERYDPITGGITHVAGGLSNVQEAEQNAVTTGYWLPKEHRLVQINHGEPVPPGAIRISELPEERRRQELGGFAETIQGAGEVGSMAVPFAAATRPVATAVGIGAGVVSSKALGGIAHEAGATPEAEELTRQIAFFVPSALGVLSGLKTGQIETPQGRFSGAAAFGGRLRGAVAETPEAIDIRGQVGGTRVGIRIPRRQAPPPEPSDAAKMLGEFEQGTGKTPTPPSPPQPKPDLGPEHLTPEVAQGISESIMKAPPEARPKLMLEAHQNMVRWMIGRGTFTGPDGKIHTVDNEGQAKKLASQFINDEVDRIDQAQAEAAKVQAKTAAQPTAKPARRTMPAQAIPGEQPTPAQPAAQPANLPSEKGGVPAMGREMTQDTPAVKAVHEQAKTVSGQEPLVMAKKETPEDAGAIAKPAEPVKAEDLARVGETHKESGRQIVQPSNDEVQNERLAAEAAPELAGALSQIASRIPGANYQAPMGRMRPQKNLERVDEKVDGEEKPPETIQDYLASQIVAETPQAKDQIIAALRERYPVLSVEDKFLEGRQDLAGYASANVQVQMPNGESAEVQVVLPEIQANTDRSHRFYTDGRKADLAGDKEEAAKQHGEAKRINTEALDAAKARLGIEEGRFEKGSTQININPQSDIGQAHAVAAAAIPDEHLMPTDFGGNPKGREDNPHVTVRYGLKDDSPEAVEKIKEAAAKIQPFEVPIGKTDTFPASEHSDGAVPVIARLETTPELKALREAMEAAGDFQKDTFPEYKPHITLAYVKPEVADQYKGGNQLEGQKVPVDHIVVSKRDGSQEMIPLGGSPDVSKEPDISQALIAQQAQPVSSARQAIRERERRQRPRDFSLDNSRIQEFRRELLNETNPEKRAELEQAIAREKDILASRTPELEARLRELRDRPPEHTRAMAAPRQIGPAPGQSGQVDPRDLAFDPKRFQYKLNVNERGVTNLLAGKKWNPDLAGIVNVWRDPTDGKLYVVNGHHRAQLALDNGVGSLLVRHLNVNDASEARAIGALQNIAEGRGTAVDAAKFFRERGISPADLDKHGISLGEATAANGLALSRLDPSVFEKVVMGQMADARGVAIGQATDDPAQQEAIVKLIDKQEARGRKITNDTVAELARFVALSGNRTVEQGGLFGANQEIYSLALEKAEVSAYIRQQLAKERRVFGAVSTEGKAATLGQVAGQKIKAGENREISQRAAQAEEAYNKLSSSVGPVNTALDKAARELASGNYRPEEVKTRAYQAVRDELRAALAGGQGAGAERVQESPGRATGANEALLSREAIAPTFFSKAEKTADEKLPRNAAASSVLPTLRNAGVKEEELKWLGLDDWLKDRKLVSKQQVLDFIRENNVHVKEVTKGAAPPRKPGELPEGYKIEQFPNGEFGLFEPDRSPIDRSLIASGYDSREQLLGDLENILQARGTPNPPSSTATKFSEHQLPGGENYRELLLTLPERHFTDPTDDRYFTEAGKNVFTGGHFDEPNVLAHVRFNDRSDADGKKVLFIEEVQSDWHQKGRAQGYAQPYDAAAEAKAKTELDAAWNTLGPLLTKADNLGYDSRGEARNDIAIGDLSSDRIDETGVPGLRAAADAYHDAYQTYQRIRPGSVSQQAVPDAPFKTTWHELAMKRMLRYAAENGYDKVAWTTGAQQADRYDLGKQVDSIQVHRTGEDNFSIKGVKNGAQILSHDATTQQLPDLIGKDLAKKIIESPVWHKPEPGEPVKAWYQGELVDGKFTGTKQFHGVEGESYRVERPNGSYFYVGAHNLNPAIFEGKDLQVGGQGMKGFYDKILPDFLNKYGKKWGAKVGETAINASNEGVFRAEARLGGNGRDEWIVRDSSTGDIVDEGFDDQRDAESMARSMNGLAKDFASQEKVHSVDITPSMRDSVLYEGQPLFNLSNDDLANWARNAGSRLKIEKLGAQGNIFGGQDQMFRLSTSKQNSVTVTADQLKDLSARVPALARRFNVPLKAAERTSGIAFDYKPPEAATLFGGQKPPVLDISRSAKELLAKGAPNLRGMTAANMSIQQARQASGALRALDAGELPEGATAAEVRELADAILQASKDARNSGITIHVDGAPEHAKFEELFHGVVQRELGKGEVGEHLPADAVDRVMGHEASHDLQAELKGKNYPVDRMPAVYQVAEMAAKIVTGQHSLEPARAADWFANYVAELHKAHGPEAVAAAFANAYDGAQEAYEQANRDLEARAARPGGSESGIQPAAQNLPGSAAGRAPPEAGRGNRETPEGRQGTLDQPFLLATSAPAHPEVADQAIDRFGLTDDPVRAGFILPDGRMLNLGRDLLPGRGFREHNQVANLYGEERSGRDVVGKFLNDTGAVRFDMGAWTEREPAMGPHYVLAEAPTAASFTPEQRRVIQNAIQRLPRGRNVMVQVGGNWAYGTARGVSVDKLIADAETGKNESLFNREEEPKPRIGPSPARQAVRSFVSRRQEQTGEAGASAIDLAAGAAGGAAKVAKAFFEKDLAPITRGVTGGLKEVVKAGLNVVAPRMTAPQQSLDVAMKMKGEREEQRFRFERAMAATRKMLDQMPEEDRVRFIDNIMHGRNQASTQLDEIAQTFRQIFERFRAQEKVFRPDMTDKENYFHLKWRPDKLPAGVDEDGNIVDQAAFENAKAKGKYSGFGDRPLQGGRSFMKQKTLPDASTGLARGGELISTNPVDLVQHRVEESLKFTTARKAWEEHKATPYTVDDRGRILHIVQFFRRGQDSQARALGYDKLNDPIAKVMFPAGSGEGMIEPGEYWVEANTARLYNNFLSRDLIRESTAGRGIVRAKNAVTAWRLGYSPFHLITESLLAMGSEIGRGYEHMWNQGIREGSLPEIGKGAWTALKGIGAPYGAAREGGHAVRYLSNPDEFLDAHGVTGKMRERFLRQYPEVNDLLTDAFTGGAKLAMHEDFRLNALQGLRQAVADNNYIGAAFRTPMALNQALQYPLFEVYIPRLKLGMFLREYSEALEDRAAELESGKLNRTKLARDIWDGVDHRFGELNWDNFFWNRTFKTANQLLWRAFSWTYGNFKFVEKAGEGQLKEIWESAKYWKDAYDNTAGTGDQKAKPGTTGIPRLDRNMAKILGMAAAGVAIHTLLQLYLTHELPRDHKDLIAPRDGTMDKNGQPNRWSAPLVPFKDVESAVNSPGHYVRGKFADIWTAIPETLNNRDFNNHLISHPSDPWWEQMFDRSLHIVGSPIGYSRFRQEKKQGSDTETALLGTLGISRVSKNTTATSAEKKMREIRASHYGPMTDEELEAREQKDARIAAGNLTRKERQQARNESRKNMWERDMKEFTYDQVKQVYDLADEEEREAMARILRDKRRRALQDHFERTR